MKRMHLSNFSWVALLALTFGCSGKSGSGDAGAPALASEGQACATSANCMPGLGCGVDESGSSVCVETCNDPYGFLITMRASNVAMAACWNGLETPCQQLPTDSTCGCGCGTNMYCDLSADQSSGQCVLALTTGTACDADVECSSGVCFTPYNASGDAGADDAGGASICSVPLGGSCFSDDCDDCVDDGSSVAWCSADCSTRECPANFICLTASAGGMDYSRCFETCTSSSTCPTGNSCQRYETNSGGTLSSDGACEECTIDAPCP
jgi:hypothetical protein